MTPDLLQRFKIDPKRRGKVLALFAVLLPFLVGGMALSVDTGVIATARSHMQTTADAAALAGARQYAFNRRPAEAATMLSRIRSSTLALANQNRVLGDLPVLNDNPDNATSGEIILGYLEPRVNEPYKTVQKVPDSTRPVSEYNSVYVQLHRDPSHGGAIPGFFSSLFSKTGTSLRVSSVATMRNHVVEGFKAVNNQNAGLLPIVLDLDTYNEMMKGTTTDQFTWSDGSKTVSDGPDGIVESKLYPVKNGNPGNWGTIKVGVSNNSTSTLGDQIRYGITPSQLATFPGGEIRLNSSLSPPSITFEGNPGISAGIKDDLASIIGRPVFIPIYDNTGGNGNNAWYRVVKFAGVRIVYVDFKGNPKYVIVQPAQVQDPTGIPGKNRPDPAFDDGGLVRLYLSR